MVLSYSGDFLSIGLSDMSRTVFYKLRVHGVLTSIRFHQMYQVPKRAIYRLVYQSLIALIGGENVNCIGYYS